MAQIHLYANESLTFGDDDYYDIDFFNGTGYETKKILGSTIKAGINAGAVSVNIYNTDGSLTGNRALDGNGKILSESKLLQRTFAVELPPTNTIASMYKIAIDPTNLVAEGIMYEIIDSVTSKRRFAVLDNGIVEINELYNLPLTDGTLNQIIKTDGAGNLGWFDNPKLGNYAQTVQSTTIIDATETTLVGTGVGSLAIPANAFVVGDSFHAKIGGVLNASGGGGATQIIVRIKAGATILASTGAFQTENAVNEGWECELDFTIAVIGATGTICTNGNFAYTKTGDKKVAGTVFQDVQPIDTTVANTLNITAEFSNFNAGNTIYSANFVLYKVY